MKDRSNKLVLLLFGSLACLALPSVVNADGRLFVLNLENSTGLMGFRGAEQACAALHARLASPAELRHAVVECFFSACARGWLYGGTVGTTVCNVVAGALKAVDVKTENATEDFAHLNAFCIKDRGAPCGDPPSFPNARLQGHSGYELGDELLYTCVPGFVMPSGHKAFSLLCDSCGEWYGMVEICVKDESEGLVDYEDRFPDTFGGVEDPGQRAEEANGEVQEEVLGAAHPGWTPSQQHQETTFSLEQARRDMTVEGEVAANGEEEEEKGDFIGHPTSEQEPEVAADAATEAPVSLLSQKHMFWFPSEAFQDEVTQRDSTVQSEESKEDESQERNSYQKPTHPDDSHQESDHYLHGDPDNHDDPDSHRQRDSRQDYGDRDDQPKPDTPTQHQVQDRLDHPGNQDNGDGHYDMGEHDEGHSREHDERDETYHEHDSDEDDQHVTEERGDDDEEHLDDSQEQPDQDDNEGDDDQDHRDHYANTDDDDRHDDDDHDDLSDDHDDHHDHDDLSDDHDDHHDHDDLSDDHHDHDHHDDADEHADLSDDHRDHDDGDEQHHLDDLSHEDDHHDDHDDHRDHHDDHDDHRDHHDDRDDYDDQRHHDRDRDDLTDHTDENNHDSDDDGDQEDHQDNDDPGDPKDHDQNSDEDPDSHEDDRDHHGIFSITRDHHQNTTETGDGGKSTTDDAWLDGYPVAENEDSVVERSKDEHQDTGAFNEVESQKPLSHTGSPEESRSSSKEPPLQQEGAQETWPGFIPTAKPTFISGREHAAPTFSWNDDLTQQSSVDRHPAPPVRDSDAVMEEHTMHSLPGESGERGEMEGEIGGTVCTGENCPPPASAGQRSKVASIIVVVCLLAIAVMVGVWCYRRQQQKSSVYEMNGKEQGPSRPAQQMEMQQKV